MTAAQVHLCRSCGRRLPVNYVVGVVQVFCRYCKDSTMVSAPAPLLSRERC